MNASCNWVDLFRSVRFMCCEQALARTCVLAGIDVVVTESSCSRSPVVDYDTPASNYYMTVDVYNDYGSCGEFAPLTQLLAGSGQRWYSSCQRTCVHILTIQETEPCSPASWQVLNVGVTVRGVIKTEVHVDDVQVFSVSRAHSNNS